MVYRGCSRVGAGSRAADALGVKDKCTKVVFGQFNHHDGFISDADVEYMRRRGEGVVGGLCFMQGVYMDEPRKGQGYVGQAACWDDKFIPGLKRIADAIHDERAIAMEG